MTLNNNTNKKGLYIVLKATTTENHQKLVDVLRPHIGEEIGYIDIAPETELDAEEDVLWVRVDA